MALSALAATDTPLKPGVGEAPSPSTSMLPLKRPSTSALPP